MFVKSKSGDYYPVSRVEKMWSEGHGPNRVEFAEIADLGPIPLYYEELTSLAQSRFQPFPAAPGFYALEPISEDDGSICLQRYPVLGWLHDSETGLLPITNEGINHGSKNAVPILSPDGQVIIPMSALHDSIDSYLKYEFFDQAEPEKKTDEPAGS